MDGFEATEGIVMMAATNRPDILDPALLRPGRFDRQIVVPLPELRTSAARSSRCTSSDKKIAADVDLDVVARGTPGMSGADLANLVNEAALFAVRARRRRGPQPTTSRRPATGCSWASGASRWRCREEEKEVVAYHEGGHAVLRRTCSSTPTRCTR